VNGLAKGGLALGGLVVGVAALKRALNPRPRYASWEKPPYGEFENKVLVLGGADPPIRGLGGLIEGHPVPVSVGRRVHEARQAGRAAPRLIYAALCRSANDLASSPGRAPCHRAAPRSIPCGTRQRSLTAGPSVVTIGSGGHGRRLVEYATPSQIRRHRPDYSVCGSSYSRGGVEPG
jgi:hypothetical protein